MTILSKRGYEIKKSDIKDVKELESELTVQPLDTADYGALKKFPIYKKKDDTYYVPKFYGIEKFGQPKQDLLHKGRSIDIKFKGNLRDYQQNISDLIQKSFKTTGGGVISLPCGRGKTIISIESIVRTGVKTLVIVHKEYLIEQWIRQIKNFTNAKVGRIQRDRINIKGCDIVVAMLKSLSMRDYDDALFEEFGLVIIDECHHMGAEVYSRAFQKVVSKYTLGLSATPERLDGMSKIIYWNLGPIIYREDVRQNDNVHAKIYKFATKHPLFKTALNWGNKKPNKEKMITNLTKIPERTQLIIDLINERRTRGNTFKMLILSRRRAHLKFIKQEIKRNIKRDLETYKNLKMIKKNLQKQICYIEHEIENLKKINIHSTAPKNKNKIVKQLQFIDSELEKYEKRAFQKTGYYRGGMKQHELSESEECDIIFGTFDMAEEGLDIPTLNTIVLATPKPRVIQSVGRILRSETYDVSPEVIDIADQLSLFTNFGISRQKYYIKAKYHMHEYSTEMEYDTNNFILDKKGNKIFNVKKINIKKVKYTDTSKLNYKEVTKKKTPVINFMSDSD